MWSPRSSLNVAAATDQHEQAKENVWFVEKPSTSALSYEVLGDRAALAILIVMIVAVFCRKYTVGVPF